MADKQLPSRPKTTIEIPLPSIRKYVPGSGPPPPRISLAPPRDSTAYIIDRFILPADKDMTETSRRLVHYRIGFTDLPTVKLLIPCNEVLDYVSPRELEDWEYRNLEMKEQARLLAESQQAGPKEKKKKTPGRPAKIPMEDVGGSVLDAADGALLLAQEVGGPSLSTPQKRKPERALAEAEIGESASAESDDAAICRQLEGRGGSEDMESDDNIEVGSGSVHQRGRPHVGASMPAIETPSRLGSIARPSQDTLPQRPAIPRASSAPGSGSAASDSPSHATPLENIHPAWAQAVGRQKGSGRHAEGPGAAETSSLSSGSLARKRKGRPPNGGGSAEEKQQAKRQKIEQENELPPDEWEVRELLDDQWFIEAGTKVHKYLVLWEGDWPEDQNPTWEPEENVQDRRLINRYLQKKKAGLLKPPTSKQKTPHHYWAGARYSSVAEAFEAGIDERPGEAASGAETDADQPDEMLLVTENLKDIAPPPPGLVFDALLARHNQPLHRGS
ncbi:hypothetical protein VTH06DRAFT_8241 [Thermothelomyces fergusii]